MVERQLRRRGLKDERVLTAMGAVPREAFVPEFLKPNAYEDRPLPIGLGQTISQPYIVALMLEAVGLCPGDRVLEIGTGSGYAAAVTAALVAEVFTIERLQELVEAARKRFEQLGIQNIHVTCGDGSLGWAEEAPFDVIIVTAAVPKTPKSLALQLKEGGRMIFPRGSKLNQDLLLCTRVGEELQQRSVEAVRFVPLIGEEGWDLEDI